MTAMFYDAMIQLHWWFHTVSSDLSKTLDDLFHFLATQWGRRTIVANTVGKKATTIQIAKGGEVLGKFVSVV